MTDAPAIARPSQLWKSLPPERRLQAAEAFWNDQEAGLEQAEAVALIAQKIKFRAKSVITMPADKRARHLASYHLAHQRPMMGAFLDAVGIAHENGMIADDEAKAPASEALRKGASAIGSQFPKDDVALYLSTLLWQDAETWGALAEAPERTVSVSA
jgi:hypothetical protein